MSAHETMTSLAGALLWTSPEGAMRVHGDDAGVLTLSIRMPGPVNTIGALFRAELGAALAWLAARDEKAGLIVASERRDFCAGADLKALYGQTDAAAVFAEVRELQGLFRRLETLGVPVVAAITGHALGGGYELALACHHRIALDDPRLRVGLPEVTLGLLPGAGGTQRLPRLLGMQAALEVITAGRTMRAPAALQAGLVDALAPDVAALRDQALAFITANPERCQPWDAARKRYPPPRAGSPDARNLVTGAAALIERTTWGAYDAPKAALAAVQEGFGLDFDPAAELEARKFTALAVGQQSRNMLRTLWFARNAAERGDGLRVAAEHGIERVGILGAGMMGAGLAGVCARAGFEVVCKDLHEEALAAGRAHVDKALAKRGDTTSAGRITWTLDDTSLQGVDLVIEAVVESIDVKHAVTRAVEPGLAEGGIWASNTSALPIGALAEASVAANRFIGLHFFSPVEKMQLVEIIVGPQTDDETLGRALAFARAIRKTPIVVGDGYGFYTSRVFTAYIMEAAQLVAEGHHPALIEYAARAAGMAAAPLQVFDEVTLTLALKAREGMRVFRPGAVLPGFALVEAMVQTHGRPGRAAGAGFYDYDERGKRRGLWPGLSDLAAQAPPENTGVAHVQERLLLAQAAEAVRCIDEGVITRHRDAELGAVLGLGFAPQTGGPLGYLDGLGHAHAIGRLEALAADHGPRYEPPETLRNMAELGTPFFA